MEINISKFGENINYENKSLIHNIQKYIQTLEYNLPTTITDSIRGFEIIQKTHTDLSGMKTMIILKLDKRVDYYHSNHEIDEILSEVTKLPNVAIKRTILTPLKENNYTKYKHNIDIDWYNVRGR